MADESTETPQDDTELATPEGAVDEQAATVQATDEAAAPDAEPAVAAEAAPEAAPAEPEGPDPSLSSRERRAWYRQRAGAGDGTPRSAQERHEQRGEQRRAKAAARRRRRGQERERRRAAGLGTGTAPAEHEPGRRQVRQGVVTSAKGTNTLTVRVDLAKRHPKYKKIVRSSVTLHVHDEDGRAGEGDTVRVVSCRPRSRTKRWELTDVLERAK